MGMPHHESKKQKQRDVTCALSGEPMALHAYMHPHSWHRHACFSLHATLALVVDAASTQDRDRPSSGPSSALEFAHVHARLIMHAYRVTFMAWSSMCNQGSVIMHACMQSCTRHDMGMFSQVRAIQFMHA